MLSLKKIEFNLSLISSVTWSFSIPIDFGGSCLPIIDTIAFKKLSLLIHPFMPHLSEELNSFFGSKNMVVNQSWPRSSGVVKKTNYKLKHK